MLTPDYFYGKSDKLIEMYQDLEDWILQDIASRLMAAGSLSGTADRELWKLQQMGLHRQEIIKRISQLTGKSRNEVRRLLRDSVLTSFSDDESVLERLASVQPPLENNAVIAAMNDEMMKTFGELSNLTNTTIDQSQRDLLNLLNEVDFRVASGLQSYSSAICEVLDRYAENGMHVNYPTGSRRSLEAAVRCCIVTSMNQTAAQVTNKYIVEAEAEYVLVSAHMGARHDKNNPTGLQSHDHWQGKVYKIQGADPDAPNLLESTGYDIDLQTGEGHVVNPLGLHGYNCRHSHKPWDKSLRNPYVDADGNPKIDIHESQKLYDLHQKQRAMERAIRKTKRQLIIKEQEMKAFPDDPNIQSDYDKLSATLRMQNRNYGTFCAENQLRRQYDRVKVAGFKRKQAATANGRATAYGNTKTKTARSTGVSKKVYYDSNKNYRIDLPETPSAVNDGLSKAAAEVAKLGSDTMWEHCKLVNLKTGKIEFSTTDQEFSQVGGFYKHVLENEGETYAFIHNHNTATKLSLPDLQILAGDDNIKVIAAVRNDGIISLVESNGTVTNEYLPIYYEKQINQYIKEHAKEYGADISIKAEEYAVELAAREFGKGMGIYGNQRN